MEELRAEARELNGKLANDNPWVRREAIGRSREVLGEYMSLFSSAKNGRGKDAPWEQVGAMKKSAAQDPTAQKMMNTPENASRMMNAVASGDLGLFQSALKQGLDAVKAEAAPKVPEKQQPGYGFDGRKPQEPQGPQGPVA